MSDTAAGAPRFFWYEIAAVLAVKAVLLALLYFSFFASPPAVPATAEHLFEVGSTQ